MRARGLPSVRDAERPRNRARRRAGRRAPRSRQASCRRSRERLRPCPREPAASARDSRARCRSGGKRRSEAPTYIQRMSGALPRNVDVAEQLEFLADLLELEGEASFRVLAYRRAATRIRETAGSVAELALAGRAKELSGIGKTIEEKIVQVVEDGEMHALTKRKKIIPPEVVSFMRLPGLGPKTAARIWQELGVTTIDELKQAAEQEQLRTLAGLGAKTEERILKALAEKKKEPSDRRLLGEGLGPLLAVVQVLREHPAAVKVSEAGSARRRKETFRDLDIIATATDPEALIDYFTRLKWVIEVVTKGPTKATVLSNEGLRFDLRVVPPESYGNLLQHFTGSKDHNVALREAAVRKKLSVSEYSVTETETGEEHTFGSEEELYDFLGYQFIPPELRENCAELDRVVASVHAAREKNPLERVFAAMENPYVDCIGHLTGRKLNKRGPVDIDIERVIEKALETKTFLELNSQPDRLDLRDVHARAAREAGLKLVVNSDGHEIAAQGYVEFGVGQARRAWLTKADVVNTRTWKQIEKLRKRRPST